MGLLLATLFSALVGITGDRSIDETNCSRNEWRRRASINAAIRAVVRTGIEKGWKVLGVRHGYAGLMNDDFIQLGSRDVSGIIQRGGTILGSTRCPAFKTEDAQVQAVRNLRQREIDALIVIGGDGSQAGAFSLSQRGFPVVGIASTIDNDLFGSEMTIGVDTALNVALEGIDRIKVTASSHERAFLETVVVAEGAKYNADGLSNYFQEHRERIGFDLRVIKLGHVQRGGTPGVFDRLLATRFGAAATDQLAGDQSGVLVGLVKGELSI